MRFEPPLSRKLFPLLAAAVHLRHPHIVVRITCVFFNVFILCFCSLPSCLPVLASMGKRRAAFRVHLRYWRRIVFLWHRFSLLARPLAVDNRHKAAAGMLHYNPLGKTYGFRNKSSISNSKNLCFYIIMVWSPPFICATPLLVKDVCFLLILIYL